MNIETAEIRTAPATEKPCEIHRYHFPRVVRTQGHHEKPVFLQNRLYGRIVYGDLQWVCGTCHDSIHAWLDYLLGKARMPSPVPGRIVRKNAEAIFDWYKSEAARLGR